ncbi:MAG: hypothetical protein K2W95_30800, partial [Candidatus Obscuribacterales bacterium]|nr:hypothetical protein [Candidatus Obscuribacterales bacterium]
MVRYFGPCLFLLLSVYSVCAVSAAGERQPDGFSLNFQPPVSVARGPFSVTPVRIKTFESARLNQEPIVFEYKPPVTNQEPIVFEYKPPVTNRVI